jgi:hypothetical protein
MGRVLRRVVRFLIGSALFMAGSMLMLLAAVAVFTLPVGFFMLALGLELMVAPGRQAERATPGAVGSASAADVVSSSEGPTDRSRDASRAA